MRVHPINNLHGDAVELLDYGARIRSLTLALAGGPRNVVLGYAQLEDYLTDRYFLGAVVGRYANRIGGARFSLDGREYRLSANEGANHLHGGADGFDKRFWSLVEADASSATYRLESPDGDQGYPGRVTAEVRYRLLDTRELEVRFRGITDAPTYLSLTQHAYFNLDGADSDRRATVLSHRVRVASGRYTPTDDEQIPTGEIASVTGSDLDLRAAAQVADLVGSDDPRLRSQRGADINYVLDGNDPAVEVTSSRGDLSMEVATTCPAVQLYTGQRLSAPFAAYAGLCVEAQHFPDSPNKPIFPSTLLEPGETYEETVIFRFRQHQPDHA